MIDALNHFKRYGPMLRTLRTKGLAPRHWKMVAQRLNLAIDPGHVTMYRLIRLGLYDDEKLKTIKQVCEVATKEYAVQQALEGLDKEMRSAEFEFEFTQDASMIIVNKLPELIIMFEEYSLRIGVLRTNPNVKNLIDRLLEIERIIKNVLELLHEWAIFQRNFVYLHGIFVLEEIQSVLPEETRLFLQV
jgi:dynein heavy chain